jgi:hypothetical protein
MSNSKKFHVVEHLTPAAAPAPSKPTGLSFVSASLSNVESKIMGNVVGNTVTESICLYDNNLTGVKNDNNTCVCPANSNTVKYQMPSDLPKGANISITYCKSK